MTRKYHSPLPLTYINIRKVVGILAMSLPLVIFLADKVLFGRGLQTSISAYYYTELQWFFIFTLCCIGFFLLFYQGYEPKDTDGWFSKTFTDRRLAFVAGIAAFMTAFFPTNPNGFPANVDPANLEKCIRPLTGFFSNLTPQGVCNTTGYIHLASAATMFLTVAFFSWFRFTKTNKGETLTNEKKKRNVIYRVCGGTIFAAIITIALSGLWEAQYAYTTYWGEFVSLLAFGVTWAVKGEALWKDAVPQRNSDRFNVLQSQQYQGYKSGLPFFVFLVSLWLTILLYAAEVPPFNVFSDDQGAAATAQTDESPNAESGDAASELRTLGFIKADAQKILFGIVFILVVIVFYFILNNQALALFWPLVRRNFRADLSNDPEGEKEALWTLFSNQVNELGDQPRFSINPRAESAIVAPTTLTPESSYLKIFFDLIAWIFPRLGYSLRLTKLSSKESGTGLSLAVVRNDRKENIAEKAFWAKAYRIEEKDDEAGKNLETQKLLMIPAYYWFADIVDRMDGFEPEPHEWESSAYYRLGDQLWHADLEKGINCYSNSINLNQKNYPAYAALGRIWIEKSQDYFRRDPDIAIEYLLLAVSYLTICVKGSIMEKGHDQVYFGALYNQLVAMKYLLELGWKGRDCSLEEVLKKGYSIKQEAVSLLGNIRRETRASTFNELKSHSLANWLFLFLPTLEFVILSLEARKETRGDMDAWLLLAMDKISDLPGFERPVNMDRPMDHTDKSGMHFTNSHYRVQYNAACFYSQIAALAPRSKRTKYTDLALDHLVMALSAGGGLKKFAQKDSALEPIRNQLRYRELVIDKDKKEEGGETEKNKKPGREFRSVYRRKDGKWVHKESDSKRASKGYNTQAQAANEARRLLRKQGGGELIVHGENGKIRLKDTIAPGHDPGNIKG